MANNMGAVKKSEVERFFNQVKKGEHLNNWKIEWTRGGDLCEKNRLIIFIDKNAIGRYPWEAKERVLHEVTHIFTDDDLHGERFYLIYCILLLKYLVKGVINGISSK